MHRFVALLFAFAFAVAPAATTLCQAICAAHERADATTEHACHEQPARNGPLLFGASAHPCGHATVLPTALGQAPQTVVPPAVLLTVFSLEPASHDVRPAAAVGAHSPPGVVPRASQLRL